MYQCYVAMEKGVYCYIQIKVIKSCSYWQISLKTSNVFNLAFQMKIEMTRKLEQLYFMFKRKTCNNGINIKFNEENMVQLLDSSFVV